MGIYFESQLLFRAHLTSKKLSVFLNKSFFEILKKY